jgi:putrescine transport system permease protein
MLVLGLVFLYVPILSMMVFSFNNSRLVTVWDAVHSPTLKWYHALLHNEQILGAAFLSIRIALVSASAAVVLGTLAGMALARFGPFRGRLLLAGMTTAPIVMPEVITGLSLLLLFVAMGQLIGWPRGAGAITITLAHITFCMAYVTVVVQSRLTGFDESLEEAAMDLGARPLTVFGRITLPLILPAIASGWLLAFTLSWDDLVITQFVAGPGRDRALDRMDALPREAARARPATCRSGESLGAHRHGVHTWQVKYSASMSGDPP